MHHIFTHRPIDCDCSEIEREDLPYGCSQFISSLYDDLENQTLHWLELHYPELIFGSTAGLKKPKHDFCKRVRGGWRWADWRTKK